jgi:hypothetical protein
MRSRDRKRRQGGRGKGPAPRAARARANSARRIAKAIELAISRADQIRDQHAVVSPKRLSGMADYELVDFKIQEVVEGGKRESQDRSKVIRNLGGTPVERWHARGKLDERKMASDPFLSSGLAHAYRRAASHRQLFEPNTARREAQSSFGRARGCGRKRR